MSSEMMNIPQKVIQQEESSEIKSMFDSPWNCNFPCNTCIMSSAVKSRPNVSWYYNGRK